MIVSLIPFWQVGAAPKVVLVDEVAAVINRHVVTRSELLEEASLLSFDKHGTIEPVENFSSSLLKQVLEFLVDQRLILDEATQLGLPVVTDTERQRLLAAFKGRFSAPSLYKQFLQEALLTELEVEEILVRHLMVDRLKENKIRTVPEITAAEITRYYDENRARFGGVPLETLEEAIRLRLLTQNRDRFLARWLTDLHKRAEVRILFAAEESQSGE